MHRSSSAARRRSRPCRAVPPHPHQGAGRRRPPDLHEFPAACPPPVRCDGLAGAPAEARPDRSGLPRLIGNTHSSLRAFAALAAGYWTRPAHRLVAWTLTAGMVVFGVINVGIALWLNLWNRDFFNALEKRRYLAAGRAALHPGGNRGVGRRRRRHPSACPASPADLLARLVTQVTTRAGCIAGRQYQLGLLADECDNPDGRIAEDIASRPSLLSSSRRASCNVSCSYNVPERAVALSRRDADQESARRNSRCPATWCGRPCSMPCLARS